MTKVALALGLLVSTLLVAATLTGLSSNDVSAGAGGMAAMSVDMDIAGNDATTLGARDECTEVSAGDTIEIDVTAMDIPEATAMLSFQVRLLFDTQNISVVNADSTFLLASTAGSNLLEVNVAQPTGYQAAAADLNLDQFESGSGVLTRLTITIDQDAPPAGYTLVISGEHSGHVDSQNEGYGPQALNHGQLAVDVTCDSLPPIEPPPEGFDFNKGDNDCDNDVDSADALVNLRFSVGFEVNQQAGCPAIGSEFMSIFGDVDCDDDVDSVDALKILRDLVGFDANLPDGCGAIGEPF